MSARGNARGTIRAIGHPPAYVFGLGLGPRDRYGNIKSVRLYDKRAALVDIGTALGMFKKTLALTGPDGGPIQTEDSQARAFILAEIQRLTDRAKAAADDEAHTIDVEVNDDEPSADE